MRLKAVVLLFLVFLLAGCSRNKDPLDNAIILRNKLLESNGCKFNATVTADYGEKIYKFSMNCSTDQEGNLNFIVTDPATIAGITGKISAAGGEITFDDKVLAFQTIADGRITPVTAPWLFVKSVRSGYIKSSTIDSDGYTVSIDDTYKEDALNLEVFVKNHLPQSAEIFWKGRRVMVIVVEEFQYL